MHRAGVDRSRQRRVGWPPGAAVASTARPRTAPGSPPSRSSAARPPARAICRALARSTVMPQTRSVATMKRSGSAANPAAATLAAKVEAVPAMLLPGLARWPGRRSSRRPDPGPSSRSPNHAAPPETGPGSPHGASSRWKVKGRVDEHRRGVGAERPSAQDDPLLRGHRLDPPAAWRQRLPGLRRGRRAPPRLPRARPRVRLLDRGMPCAARAIRRPEPGQRRRQGDDQDASRRIDRRIAELATLRDTLLASRRSLPRRGRVPTARSSPTSPRNPA